jgi:ethanolamine ammonia-lyase large subunit
VITAFDAAAKAGVAAESDGAGAVETVCVRDAALRDLSRNSAIAYAARSGTRILIEQEDR